MALQVPHRKTLTEAVFKEPLSELTMKKRRDLLFVASFAILLTVYDLKVRKTPWLDIEVPENAPNILHGAISVALIYFLVVFLFYVWEDFRRWRHADAMLHLHSYFDLTLHGRDNLHAIAQHIEKLPIEQANDPRTKAIAEAIDKATAFFGEVDGKVRQIYLDYQILGIIQWTRLLILDFGIQVVLGVIGLYKISPAVGPFVLAIFR
jgi:hypothetical protein